MPAEVLLHVRGVIRGDIVFEPGSVQLGDVQEGTPVRRTVQVMRLGGEDWQIIGIQSSNPHISAKVVGSRQQDGWNIADLSVTLDKDASAGYLQDHLLLRTSDGPTLSMPLAVEGRVVASMTVSPSSLFLGVVQPGQAVTKSLVVKGARPFKVVSITCEDKAFKFALPSKEPRLVHVIPVTFVAGSTAGKVTETIRIVTDLGQASPQLSAYAVISSQTAANDK